jgi:hypothetical protein
MYLQGLGATQDYKAAFKLLKRVDDQGYAPAQYNLGFIYENGKGVTQNYKTAIKFYTKTAEQESARAQFNLGMMYYTRTRFIPGLYPCQYVVEYCSITRK